MSNKLIYALAALIMGLILAVYLWSVYFAFAPLFSGWVNWGSVFWCVLGVLLLTAVIDYGFYEWLLTSGIPDKIEYGWTRNVRTTVKTYIISRENARSGQITALIFAPLIAFISFGICINLFGVVQNTNGGGIWSMVWSKENKLNKEGNMWTTAAVNELAIDPTAPATIYVGTDWDGMFKSTDGGGTWNAINTGLTNLTVWALAVVPETPTTLYKGGKGGVFKTINGGETWNEVNPSLANTNVSSLAIDPATPATLYAGTDDGVIKSMDGGGTWNESDTGLPKSLVRALVIDPLTPTTLYAGTNGGIFKSTDGGGTWSAANAGLTNIDVRCLAIDPAMPTTLYAGTDGKGVFKSTNGGVTWDAANNGVLTNASVYALSINPVTPATIYAGTGGVFKSTDSGGTWIEISAGLKNKSIEAMVIDPKTTTTLYVGTSSGISKSTDSTGK